MKITDGVYQVDGVNCRVYLVEDGDKLILIDTGLPRSDKKILNELQSLGRKPTEVSTIVFTHHHMDHIGSAAKMKRATGAKTAAHEADSDYIAGNKTPPKPKNLMFKVLSSFVKPSPVGVDLILKDGDKVGRLLVIHTPGHSEGSISLLDTDRKTMFVGDSLRFVDGSFRSRQRSSLWITRKLKSRLEKSQLTTST